MHSTALLIALALLGVIWAQTISVPPCTMCTYVVNQAQAHYKKGEKKDDVGKELNEDCKSLERFYGKQAVKDCQDWMKSNLDTIYADMQAGKTQTEICTDIGECGVITTPMTTRTTTTATTTTTTTTTTTPVDTCALCTSVIDTARNFFDNQITNEQKLKDELVLICKSLAAAYDQRIVQGCLDDVSTYIDVIFVDLVNGETSSQVCMDMKECQ
ncbi:unnamed protein product, partial [Mesorhabditis belari]|uniref:Saposin B-type domain-containing protein n=1 Tax=Mesorhabditis belari TaxID=2138241 RepID=A0AAF3FGM2_9BILA